MANELKQKYSNKALPTKAAKSNTLPKAAAKKIYEQNKNNSKTLDFYATEFNVDYTFYGMPFSDLVAAEFEGVEYEGVESLSNPDIGVMLKLGAQAFLTDKFIKDEIIRYADDEQREEMEKSRSNKIGVDIPEFIAFMNETFNVKITSIERVEFTRLSTKSLDKQPQDAELEI